MGSRKKATPRRHEHVVPAWLSAREPNPPRPNRPLLVGAALLAVAWTICLIALATLT